MHDLYTAKISRRGYLYAANSNMGAIHSLHAINKYGRRSYNETGEVAL